MPPKTTKKQPKKVKKTKNQEPKVKATASFENEIPKSKIVYYCKNCKDLVDGERVGKKYRFVCPVCKETDIPWGTEKSIKSFFKVKDGD